MSFPFFFLRKIEEELGIDTGLFRGRLKTYNKFIKHDIATNLIYGTVLLAWLLAIVAIWWLPPEQPASPPKVILD